MCCLASSFTHSKLCEDTARHTGSSAKMGLKQMKQIWKERQGKQPPGHDPLLSALDLNWTLLPKPSMIFHSHFLPDCNSLKIDEYKRAGPLTGAGTRVKKKSCLSLGQWPSSLMCPLPQSHSPVSHPVPQVVHLRVPIKTP